MAVTTLAQISTSLKRREEVLRAMLPAEISVDRLRAFVLTALHAQPKLLECSEASILGACYESARVGLEPDGTAAAIVPRKVRGKPEAQFQLMYRGAIEVAKRSGEVKQVWAEVVRDGDEFDWQLGTDPRITHRPCPNPGALSHAYACARFADGFVQFRVLDKTEVMSAKKAAKGTNSEYSPWNTAEAEMWRKTAVHRLGKMLPISSAARRAMDLDEAHDQGRPQNTESSWAAISESEPEGKSRTRPSTIDVVTTDDIAGPPGGEG